MTWFGNDEYSYRSDDYFRELYPPWDIDQPEDFEYDYTPEDYIGPQPDDDYYKDLDDNRPPADFFL